MIVTSTTAAGSGTFSNSVPVAAASVPGVTATSTVYQGKFEFRQTVTNLTAVSTRDLSETLILHMTAGSQAALADGELLIDTTTATSDHLAVGDRVPVKFARTGPTSLRIGGIYQANSLIGSYLVGDAFFLAHFHAPLPVAVLLATGGSAAVQQGVERGAPALPRHQGPDPGPVREARRPPR